MATSENNIFLAGVPAFRQRLHLQPETDLVFVVSYLPRHMGIYAGMDSIVLADNASQTRIAARADIIHI
jgi:cell wall-associated NlpC family hydrolase